MDEPFHKKGTMRRHIGGTAHLPACKLPRLISCIIPALSDPLNSPALVGFGTDLKRV